MSDGERPKWEGRKGLKSLTVWVEPAVIRQVKFIALENDLKQQAVITEALNLLFHKYGKPEIA
jgi:hypothetical protein